MNDWKQKLEQKVFDYLKGYSACHDFYHMARVRRNALEIARKINCDQEILIAAALLHDVGFKGHEDDVANHRIYGMKLAEKWLPEVSFPEDKISYVVEVIRLHDNYSWSENGEKTENIEAKIIQDADRIDAIGAIGIARLGYFFGTQGLPIYSASSVEEDKIGRPNHSMLDQLRREVAFKWKNMNFDVSKKMSKEKQLFIEEYYEKLLSELEEGNGDKRATD